MELSPLAHAACSPAQRELWQGLALSTRQADPFCSGPVWQLSFHAALTPLCRPHVHADGDSLLAFAEQPLPSGRLALAPLESYWFFGSPLLGAHAPELLADWLAAQARRLSYMPRLVISGIRPDGRRAAGLVRRFDSHFQLLRIAGGLQSAASLRGGLDGFLSRRSANHRQKLAKAARRARQADIVFERHVPRDAGEADALYARMLAVESASWKGLGACGMTEMPARRLYAVLLRNLAQHGMARIILARHEERDIGFIFGGTTGTVYRGQQFSYHNAWKRWSIGNLLQVEQVRWLCEEGVTRYDMGPLDSEAMRYKAHWTERRLPIQTWLLIPRQGQDA
ncbi:GNAT family N-acetyltransferase [uncultured Desulfovibrio sp.]|uniref:GNAT family N-acetyltransferase n=1 Tax=Candidatus Desulfovibrio intestinavium TaxID=2838534 RepID=A0A9D2HMZ4_9BACT|nr:GNAT family N-acetyltransferase [uncultured Desulfovibrio sp.]HJA79162.1 GNAT family N-acetyltransferase [Candidatus Desulfovibrio intestinavium]